MPLSLKILRFPAWGGIGICDIWIYLIDRNHHDLENLKTYFYSSLTLEHPAIGFFDYIERIKYPDISKDEPSIAVIQLQYEEKIYTHVK
jgi:hypothetical protein